MNGEATYNIGDRITVRGYRFDEASSAMQKAIRRGDVKVGGYFACELVMSGFGKYVWKRLLTVSAEDCWGCITHEITALYHAWMECKRPNNVKAGRIFVSKAVILLATVVKHNRDADLLNVVVYDTKKISESDIQAALAEIDRDRCEVPAYAIDCHTKAGKLSGKTKKQFLQEEQSALSNEYQSILAL